MSDGDRVVLFFQEGPAARRRRSETAPSLFDPALPLELQAAEVGALWLRTLKQHGLTQDDAARMMRISASLHGRQIRNEDNQQLSFQRVSTFERGDVVRDVLLEVLTRRGLVDVRRQRPLIELGARR